MSVISSEYSTLRELFFIAAIYSVTQLSVTIKMKTILNFFLLLVQRIDTTAPDATKHENNPGLSKHNYQTMGLTK